MLSLKTFTRNYDWADNLSLFSADVQHAPGSLRLQNGVSSALYLQLKSDTTLKVSEREDVLTRLEMHARAAIAIRPDPNAYLNLGNAAAMRQQLREAIVQYDSALTLAPGFELVKRNISECYLALGKKESQENKNQEKAIEMFQKSIEYNPKNPEAFVGMGTSYGLMSRHLDAISSFEKASELDPGNLYVWRFLAFAYRTIGNPDLAAECEEKVRELQGNK
jgi:tetratricopeptide (TPR) repeat protein